MAKYLFVITFGRTGSTLLQGLLNSIDDAVIFGENEGFLLSLMDAYNALKKAHGHLKSPVHDKEVNPWFGASRYSEERLRTQFQNFITELLFSKMPGGEPVRAATIGFKEIRHIFLAEGRLVHYLDFLGEVFPGCKLIFLTRNINDVLASGWWTKNEPRFVRQQVTRFRQTITKYAEEHPGRSLTLDYADLVRGEDAYVRLGDFIGIAVDQKKYLEVLSRNHSYDARNLTRLLAQRNKQVSLLNKAWWRANIDEFTISIAPKDGLLLIEGALLFRGDAEIAKLFINCGAMSDELPLCEPTANMKEQFPHNPHSEFAGFKAHVKLPAKVARLTTDEGKVLAEIFLENLIS
jgi:hypothetical protein